MEPHYCRKDSSQQYLSPELNITWMYDLRVSDFCGSNNVEKFESQWQYRSIFLADNNVQCFVLIKTSVLHEMTIIIELLNIRWRSNLHGKRTKSTKVKQWSVLQQTLINRYLDKISNIRSKLNTFFKYFSSAYYMLLQPPILWKTTVLTNETSVLSDMVN